MRYLLPVIAWTGFSVGFYSGLLIPILVDSLHGTELTENQKLMKAFEAMTFLGVGEIVGGLLIGKVIDKIGGKVCGILTIISIFMQTIAVNEFLHSNNFSFLSYFLTFSWGFQDSIVNTQLNEMLGFEFTDNTLPFSIFNFV
jgi:MFS family permease